MSNLKKVVKDQKKFMAQQKKAAKAIDGMGKVLRKNKLTYAEAIFALYGLIESLYNSATAEKCKLGVNPLATAHMHKQHLLQIFSLSPEMIPMTTVPSYIG